MKKFSWAMLFTFVIISAYPVSGQTPDSTLFESDSMATEFFRVVTSNRNESFIAQMEGELVESDSTLSWSMKIYQNGVSFAEGDIEKILAEAEVEAVVADDFSPEELADMTDSEIQEGYDKQQGVYLSIIKKVEPAPKVGIDHLPIKSDLKVKFEKHVNLPTKTFEDSSDFTNVKGVLIDPSQSMANDANDLRETIDEATQGSRRIVQAEISGGNHEETFKSTLKLLEKVKASTGLERGIVLVVTDEPDVYSTEGGQDNAGLVSEILQEAELKNLDVVFKIFDPDKEGEGHGGYKLINLKDNPQVLQPTNTDAEGNRVYTQYDKVRAWYSKL